MADDIVDDIDDDDDDDEDGSMDILECILWGGLIIILEYLRINEHEILAHSMEVSPNRNRSSRERFHILLIIFIRICYFWYPTVWNGGIIWDIWNNQ